MDLRVQRAFVFLIIIFSIAFGILSVFFRSTNILGFSGDYWAGIFCIGGVSLILGLGMLLNFKGYDVEQIKTVLVWFGKIMIIVIFTLFGGFLLVLTTGGEWVVGNILGAVAGLIFGMLIVRTLDKIS